MKSSASFAMGLWVGAVAVAAASAVYFFHTQGRSQDEVAKGKIGNGSVQDKLVAAEARCDRLNTEIAQLKRTIEAQKRQIAQAESRQPTPITPVTPSATVLPEPVAIAGESDGLTQIDPTTGIVVAVDQTGMGLEATDATGKSLWQVQLDKPVKSLVIEAGRVVAIVGTPTQFDLATGQPLN